MNQEERKIIFLMKIIMALLIVLIIADLMSCQAKAGVITGEKPLAGGSYWLDKYTEVEGHQPYTEDIELLAEVMYHENWHTDKEHLAAYYTGAVVMNRVRSDEKWLHLKGDKTVYDVVYAKGQYATTKKFFTVKFPDECYQLAVKILKNGTDDVPLNVIFQSTYKEFGSGVWKCINGEYFNYE